MGERNISPLRSYGRVRGRRLTAAKEGLMQDLLPQLLITLPYEPEAERPLWLEIGFGGGEHLLEQARRHPEVTYIGCEPYMNGVASLLSRIAQERLNNIRLFDSDARLLLESMPDASLDRLFVLFPDPWPKVRHHKRRLINQDTLALFYAKMKPGALLRIATDHEDYGAWNLEHLVRFGALRWTAQKPSDWEEPPVDWVPTRYQAKAEAEGRPPLFLDWVKV